MAKVKLERWQCLELFANLVAKLDNPLFRDAAKLLNYEAVSDAISFYSDEQLLKNAILGIYPPPKNPDISETELKEHNDMFEQTCILAQHLELSEPVYIQKHFYTRILAFINLKRHKDYFVSSLTSWKPDEKEILLEGSRWWLYFGDRKEKDSSNPLDIDGVTRGILLLHPLGKAEIFHYSTKKNKVEIYIGGYTIHPADRRFLVLEMRMKDNSLKDLKLIFFVGKTSIPDINLLLGQFINIGSSVYSGTVMLNRFKKTRRSSLNFK